jgi:dienelactone hydrolase
VSTEDLHYTDGGQACRGVLARPAGTGPFPGIVLVHEAWGLGDHVIERAEMLAELGYLALAADIFGDRYIPADPPEAFRIIGEFRANPESLRSRAGAAVAALKAHPDCDGRVGAIGFCFGGSTVLELARSGHPDVLGVVSFHGALGHAGPAEPGSVSAKILVCHGAEDPLVTGEELVAFLGEMAKLKADCQTIAYTGAVHSFTNKAADGSLMAGVHYHARTDQRAWAAMQRFFEDELFV